VKRPLGHGFQLVTLAPGGAHALRLDAPFEHPAWTVRRQGRGNQPIYPGSALLFEDRWYEVLDLEVPSGLPRRFSYFLAPWEEQFPLRQVSELTPEYLADLAAAEGEKKRRIKEAGALRSIPFLLGLLPAEDQEALESTYGFSGNWNSMLSAVLLLGFSMFVVMLTFAISQGMSFGSSTPLVRGLVSWVPLFAYLLVESIVRLMYCMNSREAIGSLPVALPILTARAVVHTFTPEARTRAAVARELRAPAQELATARDHVRPLPNGRLEVLSRLPKKHWTQNVTGIRFRGEVYFLDTRETVETPQGMRHRFELVVPEREILWKEMLDYRPQEVRDIYREECRLNAAMWVEGFAFLWGFLDQETQVRIEKIYNYEPWNRTRWSLYFAVAVSLWWLFDSITAWRGDNPGLDNGLTFGCAIYLLWETLVRRQRLGQGEIRGSVVGWFLRPLVLPSLKWGPKPGPADDASGFAQKDDPPEDGKQEDVSSEIPY